MSAWDVTGAVIGVPLTLLHWLAFAAKVHAERDDVFVWFLQTMVVMTWAAFCVARLLGAQL